MKAIVPRGFTLILSQKDPNFKDLVMEFPLVRRISQDIFNRFSELIQQGKLIDMSNNYLRFSDGTELTHANMRDQYFSDIMNKYNFADGKVTYQKEIMMYVIDNIRGYWKRHTSKNKANASRPVPKCSFRGRTMRYGESTSYKDGYLKVPTVEKTIKIKVYKEISKYPLGNISRIGGSLVLIFKKGKPIILFKSYKNYFEDVSYMPKDFLAFDLNQSKAHYLTFSDGTVIPRSDEIDNILYMMETLNKIIKPAKMAEKKDGKKLIEVSKISEGLDLIKNYNPIWYKYIKNKIDDQGGEKFYIISKQRRNIRSYHKKLYKLMNSRLRKICTEIVKKAEGNQWGIAIDNITTGASRGEYGQNFSRILIEICRQKKIPYYTIPSQYTSLTCHNCKEYSKENRKAGGGEEFKCVLCGHEAISHENACLNIKDRAIEFFTNSCMFGVCMGRSMKLSIIKNQSLQQQLKSGGQKVVKIRKEVTQSA